MLVADCFVVLGAFFSAVFLHAAFTRLFPQMRWLPLLVAPIPPLFLFLRIEPFVRSADPGSMLPFSGLFLVGALSLYSGLDHSLRLRILADWTRTPGARKSRDQLIGEYRVADAAERRLAKLQGAGILHSGTDLKLTQRGRGLVRILNLLREIYGI